MYTICQSLTVWSMQVLRVIPRQRMCIYYSHWQPFLQWLRPLRRIESLVFLPYCMSSPPPSRWTDPKKAWGFFRCMPRNMILTEILSVLDTMGIKTLSWMYIINFSGISSEIKIGLESMLSLTGHTRQWSSRFRSLS